MYSGETVGNLLNKGLEYARLLGHDSVPNTVPIARIGVHPPLPDDALQDSLILSLRVAADRDAHSEASRAGVDRALQVISKDPNARGDLRAGVSNSYLGRISIDNVYVQAEAQTGYPVEPLPPWELIEKGRDFARFVSGLVLPVESATIELRTQDSLCHPLTSALCDVEVSAATKEEWEEVERIMDETYPELPRSKTGNPRNDVRAKITFYDRGSWSFRALKPMSGDGS